MAPESSPPAALPAMRLTKDSVARIKLPPGRKQVVVRDTEDKGFMVVVGRKTRTFTVQARLPASTALGERDIHMALRGPDGMRLTSVVEARKAAKTALARIANGDDPRKDEHRRRPNEPTLADAWNHYVHHLRTRRKPKPASEVSIRETAAILDRHFADWKDRPVRLVGLSRKEVLKRYEAINDATDSGYAGAKPMRTLRTCYKVYEAAHPDLKLPRNPLDGQELADNETDAADHLEPAQMQEWMDKVETVEDLVLRRFHLVSFFSGWRPSALVEARVERLNLDKGYLTFDRMKGGKPYHMPLSAHLISLLRPATNGEWIFPWPANESGHVEEYDSPELKMAGAKGNVHCWTGQWLRRNFASHAQEALGNNLDVAKLMAHRRGGVTARYIHAKASLASMIGLQERVTAYLLEKSR